MSHFIVILFILFTGIYAQENVLIYDEEKGIIFVDKDGKESKEEKERKITVQRPSKKGVLTRAKGPGDIHVKRKKDPPELYFKSGLEYYRNKDFKNALKNFTHAADRDIKPEYLLWIGKTYRQLDKQVQMFTIMERILKDYPLSDVADDALFETAFYYQKNDDYQNAAKKYTQLAEQYPFGLSYSSGEEFLEVARQQLRTMRGEMISMLKVLDIEGEMLSDIYKQFQRANNLKITGEGNHETVKAIKARYYGKLREDEKRVASIKRLQESVKWALILVIILVINIVFIIIARVKVVQNCKQLLLLKDNDF